MPTNNQRVALLRQTTKEREDRNILSFLFANNDPSRLAAVGSQSEQTSKQAQRLTNLFIGL